MTPGKSNYITSRRLSQAPGEAKRAARDGPVFIMERGHPRFVLLTVEAYERLVGRHTTLAEALGMHGEYIEFEPAQIRDDARWPDLS
jgi:PHD/YefM family antitoxin component YafN of YafNO toxin-antitoxin module